MLDFGSVLVEKEMNMCEVGIEKEIIPEEKKEYSSNNNNAIEGIDLIEFEIKMSNKYEDDVDSYVYDEDLSIDTNDEWNIDKVIEDVAKEFIIIVDEEETRLEEQLQNNNKCKETEEESSDEIIPEEKEKYSSNNNNVIEGIDLIEFGIKMSNKYEDDADSYAYDEDLSIDTNDEWNINKVIEDVAKEFIIIVDEEETRLEEQLQNNNKCNETEEESSVENMHEIRMLDFG